MAILNYSDVPTMVLARLVDAQLGGDYQVTGAAAERAVERLR